MDLNGTSVFNSLVSNIQKGYSLIDLGGLAHLKSGIYVLRVSFGEGQYKMVRILKN